MTISTATRFRDALLRAIPGPVPASIIDWGERNFRIIGSALSERFDHRTAPWLNAPAECGLKPGKYSFCKPIQSGGTTLGELLLAFWIVSWNHGDISYFWPNDLKALDRWDRYTEKRLAACAKLMARASSRRHDWTRGLIIFPHCNFAQIGVRTDRNVSSDTLRGVVCEELHDHQGGWAPGRLAQVFGRQSAVWNAISFLISNASYDGDDFDVEWHAGSQENWEVRCPGCGQHHVMRTRWQKDGLGGLRYDAEGCRRKDRSYDYTKLVGTIRYEMPCGYEVHDVPAERRALSESGRYGDPANPGAGPNRRSFRLESVAVHAVSWLDLIQEKHAALRALERGDPKPFEVYTRERECRWWKPDDRPVTHVIAVKETVFKTREGLPPPKMRYAAGDRQRGSAGELPHWWLVISDVAVGAGQGNTRIVWEGKCTDDHDLAATIEKHGVDPLSVVLDSGWDSQHVYELCLAKGYCCVKVEGSTDGRVRTWTHADKSEKIYSVPQFLCVMLGVEGRHPIVQMPDGRIINKNPRFWHCSKWGVMERLAYLRASQVLQYEIPQDVSPEFIAHFGAWTYTTRRAGTTNQVLPIWRQVHEADHLYQCCAYITMMAEMDGLIGAGSLPEKPESISVDT